LKDSLKKGTRSLPERCGYKMVNRIQILISKLEILIKLQTKK
jgi:hypothetical protein